MTKGVAWTRQQLLVAFSLYCKVPFGKMHSRNPEIVEYAELLGRTPSALAMKLTNIASLDPAITTSGRKGLKGSSKADRQMWEEMQTDWERFVIQSEKAFREVLAQAPVEKIFALDDQAPPEEQRDYSGRNRIVKSTIRVGQNFFRKAVLSAYDYKCCITGLSAPQLLVASHIIPWSVDRENRLNPRNGLALSMLHDKAFDSGLLTIDKDMTVRVSKKVAISPKDDFFISTIQNYCGKIIFRPKKFQPFEEFLEYHRENIFEK